MFFYKVNTMVRFTSTLRCCQKAIKKLNNIIIAQLTTNNWLNILNNIWRFDIITD